VRRSNVEGSNAIPFRVIPFRGQRAEYGSHPPSKERRHVLQQDVGWSNQANGTNNLPEESRTASGKSGAIPGEANVLAGKASGDDVGAHPGDLFSPHGTNVSQNFDIGPVPPQNSTAESVDLAEGDCLESAGSPQAEAEAADPAEKVDNPKRSRAHRPDLP
jgi:hypothetical protein